MHFCSIIKGLKSQHCAQWKKEVLLHYVLKNPYTFLKFKNSFTKYKPGRWQNCSVPTLIGMWIGTESKPLLRGVLTLKLFVIYVNQKTPRGKKLWLNYGSKNKLKKSS